MKKTVILVLAITFIFVNCKSGQVNNSGNSKYMDELITIMQGSYSSEKQSIADTSYFNISLRMIPIWKNKGHYLYVEQAMFKKKKNPIELEFIKFPK